MTNGRMTIEKLGLMMAKVIENMATKDDVADLRDELNTRIDNLDEKLSAKINSLHNRQDVYADLGKTVETFDKRLTKVEDKVGV